MCRSMTEQGAHARSVLLPSGSHETDQQAEAPVISQRKLCRLIGPHTSGQSMNCNRRPHLDRLIQESQAGLTDDSGFINASGQ